ncbi:hypothetical protein D3C86_2225050 [compost metagenome]
MIEDHETFDTQATGEDFTLDTRSLGGRQPDRNRHGAALHHAAEQVEVTDHRVGDDAGNVVEV